MAVVPLYRESVEPIAARLPFQQVDARASDFGGTAAAAQMAFGEQLGRLAEVGERADLAYRAQRVNAALADASQATQEFVFGLSTDQDFTTQPTRYEAHLEAVRAKAKEALGSDYAAFAREFDPLAIKAGYDVQKGALEKKIGWAKASLDEKSQQWINLAAGAGSDKEAQYFLTQGILQVDTMLQSGLIGPEEAVKRRQVIESGVLELRARKDMLAAPSAFLDKIVTDPAYYERLDADARQRLIEQAQRQVEISVRDAEHADVQAGKLRKQQGEAIEKMLTLQADQGRLTRAQIEDAAPFLDPPAVTALLARLHDVPEVQDNPLTVVDLQSRISEPGLFRDAAIAYENQDISKATFDSIVAANRSALAKSQPGSPYEQGSKLIETALNPDLFSMAGAAGTVPARLAQGRAVFEFNQWVSANPEATAAEVFDEAQAIVERYQTVAVGEMKLAVGLPRFFEGTRDSVTPEALDKAEDQTLAAQEAGTLSKTQAALEVEKINAWRLILSRQAARAAATPEE